MVPGKLDNCLIKRMDLHANLWLSLHFSQLASIPQPKFSTETKRPEASTKKVMVTKNICKSLITCITRLSYVLTQFKLCKCSELLDILKAQAPKRLSGKSTKLPVLPEGPRIMAIMNGDPRPIRLTLEPTTSAIQVKLSIPLWQSVCPKSIPWKEKASKIVEMNTKALQISFDWNKIIKAKEPIKFNIDKFLF
jgi:hypothetical protein